MAQTLEYNTTVEEVTPITLPTFDDDVDNVQQLDDEPNDVGGLTAQQLKAVFDKTGADLATFLNDQLIPQVVADDATEQARQLAEGERVSNEQERVSNENARVLAETGRVSAENARNVWEPYDNDKAYVVNNKVSYNGSSYVCKANTTGHDPTNATYWEMIAAKGADGILSGDTQTAFNGVLFGNGATVEAKALDADGGAASAASVAAIKDGVSIDSFGDVETALADKSDLTNFAPVEETTTASQAYSVNSFLIYNGQLYRVTAAITQGDTLTVGTNIEAADAATYLAMVASANAIASAGVAPGGFGIGIHKTINRSAADALRAPGIFFFYDPTNPFTISGNTYSTGILVSLGTSYPDSSLGIFQLFFGRPYTENVAIRIATTAGVWGEWELFNPPMVAGTEYLTAERFLGKSVYAKLVRVTTAATGSNKQIALGITNLDRLISFSGCITYVNADDSKTYNASIPLNHSSTPEILVGVYKGEGSYESGYAIYTTSAVISSISEISIVVKYTKT